MLNIKAAQDLQNSFVIQHNCDVTQVQANLTIANLKIHAAICPSYSEETVAFTYCLLLQLIGIEIK